MQVIWHIMTRDFAGGSDSKESTCNVGDLASVPGLGRSLGEGKGYPLQYSGLEKSKECERPGFSPWVGKIPWNREHLRTLVFWPGEFHGM